MSSFGSEVHNLTVTGFNQVLTTEQTNEILSCAVRCLLDELSESAWQDAGFSILASITSNDFSVLCHGNLDFLHFSGHDQRILRQIYAFFQKRVDIDLGIDRQKVAITKFWQAEQACAVTNSAFLAWQQGRFQFAPVVESVLHASVRKIADLVGPAPTVAEIRLRFGPGATTVTPKKNACPAVKLGSTLACSASLRDSDLEVVAPLFTKAEDGEMVDVEIHANRIAFVPKNAKTDRAICTEPPLNGALQNGLGDLLTTRLRRVGIDLRDQSRNQRAALYGSISDVSATIDLSSASDTVSRKLVEHLFPADWYDLFSSLRSPYGVHQKQVVYYEKISSMGNGFTFPLETIIFWALAQSTVEKVCPAARTPVLAYGDDIVIPSAAAPAFYEVLRALGFFPNPDKSFTSGTFRESCGKDYVLGFDVRPVYVSDALSGADLFRLHNFFVGRHAKLAAFFEKLIDPAIRCYGPAGYGDGYLHKQAWTSKKHRNPSFDGVTFECWAFKPKRLSRDIAKRLATKVTYPVPKWDSVKKEWVTSTERTSGIVYHKSSYNRVRLLATYTQYLRERRVLTLTESDALRSSSRDILCDRRMPDPQTGNDEDFFIVPGTGPVHRVRVYLFSESGEGVD